jgi:hypothetical protein
MGDTLPKTASLQHNTALARVRSAAGDHVNLVLNLIDDRFKAPLEISLVSAVLTIGPSKVQTLASDGAGSTINSKKLRIPVISGIDYNTASSTLNFSTGATTGDFKFASDPGQSVLSGQYVQMGIALRSDKKFYIVWGTADASLANTTAPAFSDDDIQVLVVPLLNNGTTGAWHFVTPTFDVFETPAQGGAGGGSASTSASGGGEIVDNLFKARLSDSLKLRPDGSTPVDVSAGRTDSSLYDSFNKYFRVAYDASKTVTGTGVNMTLSVAPSFTVKAGDILVVNSEARRINTATSQTVYVLESAFSADPTAAICCVSQAVHSVDLNNTTLSGVSVGSQITTNVSDLLVGYNDSATPGDTVSDYGVAPVIAYNVSADGSAWSGVKQRATSLTDTETFISTPTSGLNLYVRFFANKASGSGFANLLNYKVWWHKEYAEMVGTDLWAAFARPSSGLCENCTHSVVGGKSRISFAKPYGRGLDGTSSSGSALKVYGNGQAFPRYSSNIDGSQGYFTEIDDVTIELDQDYSLTTIQFIFTVPQMIIDTRTLNTSRIANIESYNGASFQDFVVQSKVNVPYTAIVNRAQMTNFAADLKMRMGVERIMTQQIYRIADEYGPNGEPVWGLVGDINNQVRFVGAGWKSTDSSTVTSALSGAFTYTAGAGDYVEITAYCTGLNIFTSIWTTARVAQMTIDGGSESANIIPAGSGVLFQRYYAPNQIVPAVPNSALGIPSLTLGLHTFKFRMSNGAADLPFYGFEILNEASSLKTTPALSYINKSPVALNALTTTSYNTGFETGTLGTRGGRVLTYLKNDGTIGKAVNPVNNSAAYMTSTDHSNEEMIREYHFREFGASRSDDFSSTSTGAKQFTLDDNMTSMCIDNLYAPHMTQTWVIQMDAFCSNSASGYYNFMWYGTGLDAVIATDTSTRTATIWIDGVNQGTISKTASTPPEVKKICSGLPLGVHVMRVAYSGGANLAFSMFKTYAPKLPSLPVGAMIISSYYLNATYVPNLSADLASAASRVSTGVITKSTTREVVCIEGTGGTTNWFYYLGTGFSNTGATLYTDRSNAKMRMTFFGTGFEVRWGSDINRASPTVTLNGTALTSANYPSAVFAVCGTGIQYSGLTGSNIVATTNVLKQSSPSGQESNCGLFVSNLPLALYTVELNNPSTAYMAIGEFYIIMPVYSPMLQLPYDYQNTLNVGNNSLADLRKTTPIVGSAVNKKSLSAFSVVSASTSSTNYVPMPDMSLTFYHEGGNINFGFYSTNYTSASNVGAIKLAVNGVLVGRSSSACTTYQHAVSIIASMYLPKGFHKVDGCWKITGGTLTRDGESVLTVFE